MSGKEVCPGLCKYVPISHILKNKNETKGKPLCLSSFRMLNAIDCVAYKQHKFTSHSSGSREVQDQSVSRLGVWWEPAFSQVARLTAEGARELSRASFVRELIPFMRAPPSWPSQLPKAPPPNNITLAIRFQHMNFGKTHTFGLQHLPLMLCSLSQQNSLKELFVIIFTDSP